MKRNKLAEEVVGQDAEYAAELMRKVLRNRIHQYVKNYRGAVE
jgi:hypothetical protein